VRGGLFSALRRLSRRLGNKKHCPAIRYKEDAMTHHEKGSASDRSIIVTHIFDAPRETVFRAWTEPEMLAQWFAPEPLTVPRAEVDLRPGGHYTLVMRDPDGNEFTSTGVYREVVAPERVVYTDSAESMPSDWVDMLNEARGQAKGTPVADGVVTVTFDEHDGKTKVTYRAEYDSMATANAYRSMQMVEGLEGSFVGLDRVLAQMPSMAR
jgi:uncharacterized protein YndB with AHSA1/START domain